MSPRRKQSTRDDSLQPAAPPPPALYTLLLTAAQASKLQAALDRRDWAPRAVQYASYAFEGPRVQVTVYPDRKTSGAKLVVQGKGTQDFVQNILEPEVTGAALLGYEEVNNPEWFDLHAGCDEAGKGDVFGPLVTGCVVADAAGVRAFLQAGIKDSKKLTDGQVLRLEKIIRATPGVAVAAAACSMSRYNELMSKPGANLNRLLAWLHARSLGDALDIRPAPWGLLDQFATRDSVDEYLGRPDFRLVRRTKAESDPVVAAASIIARSGYLRAMKKLSDQAGVTLMKGASTQAQQQFASLRTTLGAPAMAHYAKLHFKLRSLG